MKVEFLDLGKQPIANNFLEPKEGIGNEYQYHLTVNFDEETKLISLGYFVPPKMMFNDQYVYHSSMSTTMRTHFAKAAFDFIHAFNPIKVLEIGSNDGVFINHFPQSSTIAVEPCGNFAKITADNGYFTYSEFWDLQLAARINKEKGKQDLVFAANCMCHIQDLDDAFKAIASILSPRGVFIFEDPSLLKMIERGSYDQIYDEHAHIFSITALQNLLEPHGLAIFRVHELTVHGGSNRVYVCPTGSRLVEQSVHNQLVQEHSAGLDHLATYRSFASRVEQSRDQLVGLLKELKKTGNKIVSYGATSKSTTVFNYCGITTDLIDYIVDTTPTKQGKLSPGMHIPVISPEEGFNESVDYAFLGAWNFKNEICKNESEFLKRGHFISHVPHVRIVDEYSS